MSNASKTQFAAEFRQDVTRIVLTPTSEQLPSNPLASSRRFLLFVRNSTLRVAAYLSRLSEASCSGQERGLSSAGFPVQASPSHALTAFPNLAKPRLRHGRHD